VAGTPGATRREVDLMESMVKGFRDFIMRGNVVDLAIAVVIGAAFGAVVTALVKDLITPLIAAIFGQPNFGGLTFTIHNSQFLYGDFINAVISFLAIAAAIYYLIVMPMNALAARRERGRGPTAPTTRQCPECLSEIPIAARRCAYCTAQVAPVSPEPVQATDD
jgi:large conductance mechanosensitive channel